MAYDDGMVIPLYLERRVGSDTLIIGLVVAVLIILVLLLAIGFIVLRSHAIVRQVMVDQKQMLTNAAKMLDQAQSSHLPMATWVTSNLKSDNLLDGHAILTMARQPFGVKVYARKLKVQKSSHLKITTLDTCKRPDIPIYEHNSVGRVVSISLHGSIIQNVDKKKIFILMEPCLSEFEKFYEFLGKVPVPTVVRLCKGNFGNVLNAVSSTTMTSSSSDEAEQLWFSNLHVGTWECCQVNKSPKRFGMMFDLNLQVCDHSNNDESRGIGVQLMCLSGWKSTSNPPLMGVCDLLFLVHSSLKAGDTLIIECETGCDKSMIFLMALLTIKMLSEFKLVSMLELVNFLRQMRFGSFTHDNMKSQLNTSMVIVAAYLKKYRPDLLQRSIKDDIGTTV